MKSAALKPKKPSDVRGPKKFSNRRIMGNAAVGRLHNENRSLQQQRRPDETTLIIDQELQRMENESKMTIRILLDNVSNDPVLKDVLRVFGIPLAYEDQILYRVLLQSKLLLDTKQLCIRLENQNLVQELSTDFHSSTTMDYNHVSHDENDAEDDDDDEYDEGLVDDKVEMTPRDAYNMLINAFPEKCHQAALSATAIPIGEAFCERVSPFAIANAEVVLRHAEELRILWSSRTVQNFFMLQRVNPRWTSGIRQYTKEDIRRLTSRTFRPEPRDLSGIGLPFPVITKIRINGADFEIHEIGGLSSRQRRKHIHSFGNAEVFMFATSLAQYDEQTIAGSSSIWSSDPKDGQRKNRLATSIDEFRFILGQKALFSQRRPIVLLTQKDLFATKMQFSSLADQAPFSNFQGSPMQGVDYLVQKFKNFPHDNWALVQVLPASNQCSVSFFVESLRQSLMSDEETLQSTESEL